MSSGPAGPGLPGRSGRTCFFIQAGFGTAFTYLTSGVFLSGLAILMGAGDILVSYLSVIVNICGVLILAFPAFLERFTSRKKLTIALTILSRLATLFIVTIPVLFPAGIRLYVFVPTVVAAFALQAQTTVVLNQWMLGFIEEKKSGRYISLRQTLTLTVTVVLSLAGGRFMDLMEGKYAGFALLFAAAALMGILEVILLAATPDGEPYQCPAASQKPLFYRLCCLHIYLLSAAYHFRQLYHGLHDEISGAALSDCDRLIHDDLSASDHSAQFLGKVE